MEPKNEELEILGGLEDMTPTNTNQVSQETPIAVNYSVMPEVVMQPEVAMTAEMPVSPSVDSVNSVPNIPVTPQGPIIDSLEPGIEEPVQVVEEIKIQEPVEEVDKEKSNKAGVVFIVVLFVFLILFILFLQPISDFLNTILSK